MKLNETTAENEVIFIILSGTNKNRLICDLVEKYYYAKKRVIISINDKEEAKNYDQLLWTWKQSSFIPHVFIDSIQDRPEEPVVITSKIGENPDFDVLIMFNPVSAKVMKKFSKIIDFAEKNDLSLLHKSRERYKEYKRDDFKLITMQPGEFLSSKI